jgi:hydroxypyruvate isomerase
MMDFSICLDTFFQGLPLEERIDQAAACGASAVEFLSWRDKDLNGIVRGKETSGVHVAAFNGLGGKSPSTPSAASTAIDELHGAIEIARQIGSAALLVPGGWVERDLARDQQLDTLRHVLASAAETALDAHVLLLLQAGGAGPEGAEPLLRTPDEARSVIDALDLRNVRMLFDIGGPCIASGQVGAAIEASIDRIGHFHVVAPPDQGADPVDLGEVFRLIRSLGYTGYVGLAFRPEGDSAEAVSKTLDLAH